MKIRTPASLLLSLLCAAPAFADTKDTAADGTFAPKEKQLSNYDTLRKKSPFEFDPPKVTEAVAANPFEGISLAGYCGNGNMLTVYLLEGKEKKRLTVFGDGSPYKKRDESGFRVVGINRGKSLKTTEIILEKDGRQGTVKFEDDVLRAKSAPPPGGVQMVRDQNGNMVPRPVIPKPGGAAGQAMQMYQPPAAFIPGQGAPPPPQPGGAGGQPVNNANFNTLAVPPGPMSNQQLINHLSGPNGQQPPATPVPAGAQPQGGGDQRPSIPPPSRRRVVLPTQ